MKNIFACVLLAACLICGATASAQNSYPQRTTIKKDKSTFIGYIGHDALSGGDEIARLELGLKWTGLLGQPVESYTFRWLNNGFYFLEDGTTQLRRSQLEAYPDLLVRYDNIKPTSIALTLDVSAEHAGQSTLSTPHHYSTIGGNTAQGRKTVSSTPQLDVLRAGCRSSNLIPMSPPKNRDFIDWTTGGASGDPDRSAQNTLAEAKSLTLTNLRVASVTWPITSLQTIYDEYIERSTTPSDPRKAAVKAEMDAFWGSDRPDVGGSSPVAAPCPDDVVLQAEEQFTIEYQDERSLDTDYGNTWMRLRLNRVLDSSGNVVVPWTPDIVVGAEGKPFKGLAVKKPDTALCVLRADGKDRYIKLYAFDEIDVTNVVKGSFNTYMSDGVSDNIANGGTLSSLSFSSASDNFDDSARYYLHDSDCMGKRHDRVHARAEDMRRNGARPLTDEQFKYFRAVIPVRDEF